MKTVFVLALLFASSPAWAEEISGCRYTTQTRTVANCTVDGKSASVPAQPGNRHWDQIVREQIPIADPE